MSRNYTGMNKALSQAALQLRPEAKHINKERFCLVMIIDNAVHNVKCQHGWDRKLVVIGVSLELCFSTPYEAGRVYKSIIIHLQIFDKISDEYMGMLKVSSVIIIFTCHSALAQRYNSQLLIYSTQPNNHMITLKLEEHFERSVKCFSPYSIWSWLWEQRLYVNVTIKCVIYNNICQCVKLPFLKPCC